MGYRKKKNIEELAEKIVMEIEEGKRENTRIFECDINKYVEGDPDSSVLVLDYLYRFLEKMECSHIVLLMNYGVNMKLPAINSKTKIKYTFNLYGKEKTINFDDNVIINVMKVLKQDMGISLKEKGNRSGFLFMYNDKWHALEVDTLLGPKNRYNYEGVDIEQDSWIFHTLGNFGLIPYGAGSPGGNRKTNESLFDIVEKKVIERFTDYPSGFSKAKDIILKCLTTTEQNPNGNVKKCNMSCAWLDAVGWVCYM